MTDTIAVETPTRAAKTSFKMKRSDWWWALCALLSLSLIGLSFYPAILFIAIILLNRFFKNRYDFLIILIVMTGSTGFIGENQLGFKLYDILLALTPFALVLVRKTPLTKKVLWLMTIYLCYLILMGFISEERWSIQFLVFRQYITFFLFILPLWFFANKDFDIQYFFRKIIVYFIVIMAFYAIDGLILCGQVLLPNTYAADEVTSFYQLFWRPFTGNFLRKWPSGMYLIILAVYPLSRYYKLSKWQWAIIILGFFASRTTSVLGAFFVTYLLYQGNFFRVFKYIILGLLVITAVYFIDQHTGSYMRIASTIDQFIELSSAQDEQDVSEFGTGRMAQIIPKYEALVDQGDLALGWGFVHPELSTNPKYQIRNDLYVDIAKADELATVTEVTQFNTVIHLGVIGLILQFAFFIGIWFLIRHNHDSGFYMSTLIMASLMGLGGFAGLNIQWGLIYVSTALGAILLTTRNRPKKENPDLQPDSTTVK